MGGLQVQAELIDAALAALGKRSGHQTNEGVTEWIDENYEQLPVLRKERLADDKVEAIGAYFGLSGVKLDSFVGINSELIKNLSSKACFIINRENMLAISGGAMPALDELAEPIVEYCVKNIDAYLDSIEGDEVAVHEEDGLKTLINYFSEAQFDDLEKVLKASRVCISELSSMSEEYIQTLAREHAFKLDVANVSHYLDVNGLDSELLNYLLLGKSIDSSGAEKEEKTSLAKSLAANAQLFERRSELIDILVSMELADYLPIESFPLDSPKLAGLLIEADIVKNDIEVFEAIADLSWDHREFAISKSELVDDIAHLAYVGEDEFAKALESSLISEPFKVALIRNLPEFLNVLPEKGIAAAVNFVIANRLELSGDVILNLAEAEVTPESIVEMVSISRETFTVEEMIEILDAMGGEYARLHEKSAKVVKLKASIPGIVTFLYRLEQMGIVSSQNPPSRGKIAVNRKRS